MSTFADYRDHVGTSPAKFFKSTLFQSERLLLGLNCLEPGQEQHVHTHAGQDEGAQHAAHLHFVVEGTGTFTVGDEVREAGEGWTVWAPADVPTASRTAASAGWCCWWASPRRQESELYADR